MAETCSTDLPDALEDAITDLLRRVCDAGLRLVTAESCTGGLVASLLTDVTGCSHAFERGFVAYTPDAKREMLGVPAEMLAAHGAVSEAVSRAMAEGALARSRADIAFSTTGFAGPTGGTGEEGLVHFACARKGRETRHRTVHFGVIGRGGVRLGCIRVAVEMIGEAIA